MTDSKNNIERQQLAEILARWRRFNDRIWLMLAAVPFLIGFAFWLFTGNLEHFLGGAFYAVPGTVGFFYMHFYLLNPKNARVGSRGWV